MTKPTLYYKYYRWESISLYPHKFKPELLFGVHLNMAGYLKKEMNRARGQKENYVAHDIVTNYVFDNAIAKRCKDEAHLYVMADDTLMWRTCFAILQERRLQRFKQVSARLKQKKNKKITIERRKHK